MSVWLKLQLILMALWAGDSRSAQAATHAEILAGLTSGQAPRFPATLQGITSGDGEVVVVLTIDAMGNVSDCLALQATNEEFAYAATQAVNEWQFEPLASTTWPRREVVQFSFKRTGSVTTLSHREAAREAFGATPRDQITTVQWDQLSEPPRRLIAPMPAVSRTELRAIGDQPVIVHFIIDTTGAVRVPVVHQIVDPKLAGSILSAVATWRYSPPLLHGQAVLVEVTRALVLTDQP